MELKWITLATFSDGSLYQCRWFRDDSGCGLEYRKHSPNKNLDSVLGLNTPPPWVMDILGEAAG